MRQLVYLMHKLEPGRIYTIHDTFNLSNATLKDFKQLCRVI